MKPEEERFLRVVLEAHHHTPYKDYRPYEAPFVDVLAETHGFNVKQALSWVEKWTRKGWWDYGVTLRSGWFTPEGVEKLR